VGGEPPVELSGKENHPAPAKTLPAYVGRYLVKRLLGQGGFGIVYLAHDEQLDRSVTVKVPQLNARDINDDNLIVGMGLLNGSKRGFVLDLDRSSIVAVPLTGSATGNVAQEINAAGQVIGTGFVSGGTGYGSNPDYYEGYSWDGPGTEPVALPPTTLNTSEAAGMNDFGATVGVSIIPTDDYTIDTVPTLWDLDTGVFELQSEIPGNSPYTLIRAWDINNDGWISLYGRKKHKGAYVDPALLLIPNAP
jgi:hypothetical protein